MGVPSPQTAFWLIVYTTVWGLVLISSAWSRNGVLMTDCPAASTVKALGRTGASTSRLAQVSPPATFGLHPVGASSMPTAIVPPVAVTYGVVVVVGCLSPADPHAARVTTSAARGTPRSRRRHRGRRPVPVTAVVATRSTT